MIVDTSALMATFAKEEGWEPILKALLTEDGGLPAPALVEFERVVSRRPELAGPNVRHFLADLFGGYLRVLPFTLAHAEAASSANLVHGTGLGGTLNLLDLMVYACAKVESHPILCTGRDFAATGIAIHPASRTGH